MEQVIKHVPIPHEILPSEIFNDDFDTENSQIPSLTTYLQFVWLGYVGNENDRNESNK